ncbi:MAG: hypothetical protein M3220_16065 [Chloroflexota bacterium]|nr:hypothetical protein [Chloroflexota bacterium]
MNIGAVLMVVLVAVVLTVAALLWAVRRVIEDKALVKRVLDGEVLLTRIFPATARKSETDLLSEQEREVLTLAMDEVLPPGWATAQSNQAIEAIYTFVEDKKQPYPALAIDLAPALTALEGKEGRRAIGAIVDTLPNCPGRSRTPPPPGMFGLPSCIPAGMNRRQVVTQVQRALSREITQRLRPVRGNVLGYEELEALVPSKPGQKEPRVRKAFQDLRQSIVQMRRLSWLLLLIAIASLALALFFVNPTLPEAALWLGWPLLISGLAIFIVSFLLMMRLRRRLYGPGSPVALQEWLSEPIGLWRRQLWLWGGVLLVVGAVLVIAGYGLVG